MNRVRFAELEYMTDAIMMDRYLPIPVVKRADILPTLDVGVFFSGITNSITEFFDQTWDSNNKTASIMAFAAYAGVGLITWPWGLIIDVALELFGINLKDVFVKIGEIVSGLVEGKSVINAASIEAAVTSLFSGAGTGGGAPTVPDNAEDGAIISAEAIVEDSERIFKKVGSIYTKYQTHYLEKNAGLWSKTLLKPVVNAVPKSTLFGFLKKIFKFIFKGIFMAIGAKMGKKVVQTVAPGVAEQLGQVGKGLGLGAYQTKLVPTSFGTEMMGDNWTEQWAQYQATDKILEWAVLLYPGLKDQGPKLKEAANKSTKFNEILQTIREINVNNPVQSSTYIPMKVKAMRIQSKADLINYFIQDVARLLGV